jgi:hypothetical protein
MNESDINALTTPITQATADMDDPRQHFAWALSSFPAPNQDMGDVAIHPMVRPEKSQRLWDLGFRHHPDLQTKWFIAGDHPEAGYLNVPTLVDEAAHAEYQAAHADPEAETEKWRATAEAMLGKLDPKLVARINSMTEEEKAAAREVQREQVPAAIERLVKLAAENPPK